MTDAPDAPHGRRQRRLLDAYDRSSEVLFGLIMVLTFTSSLGVATADRAEVRDMLIGALGCNLAWGIIDAVFHLIGRLDGRDREYRVQRAILEATDPARARRLLADALPSPIAKAMPPEELDALRARMARRPEPPARAMLGGSDVLAAFGVFLLVFGATFPVAIPFLFLHEVRHALHVSNWIAIAMLFGVGVTYGRAAGRNSWLLGFGMVVLGTALVLIARALGG